MILVLERKDCSEDRKLYFIIVPYSIFHFWASELLVIHRLSPVRTSARGASCQLPQKASSPQVSSQGQGRLLSVSSKHLEEVMQLSFTAHVFVNLDMGANNQKQQKDKGLSQKKTVNRIWQIWQEYLQIANWTFLCRSILFLLSFFLMKSLHQ